MPGSSRREFLGAAAALGGVCLGGRAVAQDREPAPRGERKDDTLADRSQPPAHVPRGGCLDGIRRIKPPSSADMVVVAGKSLEDMAPLGLKALGARRALIHRGDRVVITPNFAWASPPDQGATTSPELVRRVIQLCKEAGASSITCLDLACDATPRAFRVNGAYQATRGTGAALLCPWSPEQHVRVDDFLRMPIHAKKLKWQAVPSVLLRCDVLIDMPVIKHHAGVAMTGAVKKLMGCIWRRAAYHRADLHGCIAELAAVLRPTITIADASRVLTENGPVGPGKVEQLDRLLLSWDHVLADAYACRWLGLEPEKVPYLARAAKLGAGSIDVGKAQIEQVSL